MQCTGLSPHWTTETRSETQSETAVKWRHVETQGEAQACTAPQQIRCDSIICQCEPCELCQLCNLRQQRMAKEKAAQRHLSFLCHLLQQESLRADSSQRTSHCCTAIGTGDAWEPWHFDLVLGIRHRSPRLPETPILQLAESSAQKKMVFIHAPESFSDTSICYTNDIYYKNQG